MKIDRGLLILTLIFLIIICLCFPLYNKAYLDDFAYVQSVQTILNTGQIKVSDWAAVSLIFPIYWGSLFSQLLGFSFISLQISNIFLLFLGFIAFYLTLKELGLNQNKAIYFTLMLISFPWVLLLTFSFMTDIQFLSLSLIATYFYLTGLKQNSFRQLFLGSIFASFAILTRQIGLSLVLSIGVVLIISQLKNPRDLKALLKNLLSSLLLPILAVSFYLAWQNIDQNQSFGQIVALNSLIVGKPSWLVQIFSRVGFYLANLLIFIWPFLLIFQYKFKLKKRENFKWFFLLWEILLLSMLYPVGSGITQSSKELFYFPSDVFESDYSTFLNIIPANFFRFFWIAIIFLSLPYFVFLIIIFLKNFPQKILHSPHLYYFLALSFFLTFFWTLILPFNWAEYTLSILPFIIIFLALISDIHQLNKKIALISLTFMLSFSIINAKLTHTILGEVWHEAEILVKRGVNPKKIDIGQFAWYPWWGYQTALENELKKVGGDKEKLPLKLILYDFEDKPKVEYTIKFSFSPNCGRKINLFFISGSICTFKQN